jgi:hypothetical protein
MLFQEIFSEMNGAPLTEDLDVSRLLKMLIAQTAADRSSVLRQTGTIIEFLSALVTQSVDDVPSKKTLKPVVGGKCICLPVTDLEYDILGVDTYGFWLRRCDLAKTSGFAVSKYIFETRYEVTSEPG